MILLVFYFYAFYYLMQQSQNTPAIYTWGVKLVEELNLPAARRPFTYNFPINIDDNDNIALRDTMINFIKDDLNVEITDFTKEETVIVHKTIPEPGLKWHIDDCVLTVRKTPPEYNLDQYILLESNPVTEKYKYLYFNTPTKRLPRYTLLFYSSTYCEDFTGGKLCLSDGVEILPKKGEGILFDSREVHMVTSVKSGTRKVTVVKIY